MSKVVKYDGASFEERVISKKHLEDEYEIEVPEDLVWNAANRHTISAEGFGERLLELLADQPGMTIVDRETETVDEEPEQEDQLPFDEYEDE